MEATRERQAGPAGAHGVIRGRLLRGPGGAIHGHPLRSALARHMPRAASSSTTSGPPCEAENTGEKPRTSKQGNLNLLHWQRLLPVPLVPATVSHLETFIKYTGQCAQLYVWDLSTKEPGIRERSWSQPLRHQSYINGRLITRTLNFTWPILRRQRDCSKELYPPVPIFIIFAFMELHSWSERSGGGQNSCKQPPQ